MTLTETMDQVRRLLAAGTKGPWTVDSLGKVCCEADDGKGFIADPGDGRYYNSIPRDRDVARANADLIAAAINALPTLLAALDARTKALEEARYWIVKSGASHPGGMVAQIDAALQESKPRPRQTLSLGGVEGQDL